MSKVSASLTKKCDAARDRLREARLIAESLRHDERLHSLAMRTVFVLEDCLFELEQARKVCEAQEQIEDLGFDGGEDQNGSRGEPS